MAIITLKPKTKYTRSFHYTRSCKVKLTIEATDYFDAYIAPSSQEDKITSSKSSDALTFWKTNGTICVDNVLIKVAKLDGSDYWSFVIANPNNELIAVYYKILV